mmetsp:Transcript_150/g.440  ORF Transcript_150/g.440 Transcript_150/m.440 type:complete len:119 (-) Transcript_150:150-506(-)
MSKQIEGSAVKPSIVSRITTGVVSKFKVGTPLFSLGYGIGAGIVISGLVYAGRTLNVLLFDHDYYKLQSRMRYYEKQLLFTREQDETASAHYLAAMASEYNPVATRMPFKPLEAKYRF